MNLKLAVIMIVAIGFVAPAAAQVDNCCFVDRQCHSDRDWMDGFYAYQNGQCAAPAQSQSGSGAAGQIDNCCFVDRQCGSDQEWIDGYWAYQNNHCTASTASQSGTSTQPTSNAAGQIDNCCFAGWQCNNDQDWINGYHAYQNNQCAGSPATRHGSTDSCCAHGWNCTIEGDWQLGRLVYADYGGQCVVPAVQATVDGVIIEGSTWFFAQLNQILAYLKRAAPEWHAYLVKGPLKIREVTWGDTSRRGLQVSFVLSNTRVINLHPGSIAGNQPARSYTLMHEACHVQRIIAGLLRYDTHLHQRIEEVICDLVGVYMLDSASPAGYSDKYVTADADRLINDGVTNIYELAQAERERAFQLLSTMN